MKILTSRKNKDYYDYLSGIYGIDEKVVYDRRQFTVLKSLDTPFFNYHRLETDMPKMKDRYLEYFTPYHYLITYPIPGTSLVRQRWKSRLALTSMGSNDLTTARSE